LGQSALELVSRSGYVTDGERLNFEVWSLLLSKTPSHARFENPTEDHVPNPGHRKKVQKEEDAMYTAG